MLRQYSAPEKNDIFTLNTVTTQEGIFGNITGKRRP